MATMFEFDESDIWSSSNHHQHHHISSDHHHHQNQFKKPIRSQKSLKKTTDHHTTTKTGSLPVNVPDWAKILRQEQRREQVYDDDESDEDDEDCVGNKRIPPHEFLAKQFARTRVCAASFSVHEGIGRTLKGRDLSRVRNAIWEKTGFED